MSSLYISSDGSAVSASGVWRVSSSNYQENYNAFIAGEDVNLDQIFVSTNAYDLGESAPNNFRVGVYAAGVNSLTPGPLISFLSGPTSPTAGAYNSYIPNTTISLASGSQYWLGFTLSSDTGGANTTRVKITTSDASTSYVGSGWSVGSRYVAGSNPGLPGNSPRPVTFQLYGTGNAVCFCSGTIIRIPEGEVAIEKIKIGDLVSTSNGILPVKWVAKRTISRLLVPLEFYQTALPVVIRAHSFANGIPTNDLYVSEAHGIYVDQKITNAIFLVNGINITKSTSGDFPDTIRYFHLEFDDEVFVYANGLEACSYVNGGNRSSFDNYPEFISIYLDPDKSVSSRICNIPRNQVSLAGHKHRVRRAWSRN